MKVYIVTETIIDPDERQELINEPDISTTSIEDVFLTHEKAYAAAKQLAAVFCAENNESDDDREQHVQPMDFGNFIEVPEIVRWDVTEKEIQQ